jgi:hypothetical protein
MTSGGIFSTKTSENICTDLIKLKELDSVFKRIAE